jgi:DNA polymerase III beta subunit, C-terminal domain
MLIQRTELLDKLNLAAVGLVANTLTVEQSDCFLFMGGDVLTFNNDLLTRVRCPLKREPDFCDFAVNAADLMRLLDKIPDDNVDVVLQQGEMLLKGEGDRRAAGLAIADITSPLAAVPKPDKWTNLPDGVRKSLESAARVCGRDATEFLATFVHVVPNRIQACDNERLLRIDGPSGFAAETLLPAQSILAVADLGLTQIAEDEGWVHFRNPDIAVSLRCSHEPYHKDIDVALALRPGAESLVLPSNLADIVERAAVFKDKDFDAKIDVELADGSLTLKAARKDGTGWYRETKPVKYAGLPLAFGVDPKFLLDVLGHTREVQTDGRKMKLSYDNVQFVVSLKAKT